MRVLNLQLVPVDMYGRELARMSDVPAKDYTLPEYVAERSVPGARHATFNTGTGRWMNDQEVISLFRRRK